MNNKGFAISIMLYAFTLLMVTIFFIYFYIVKNRYTTNNESMTSVVSDINENDTTGEEDQVGPLIITSYDGFSSKASITNLEITVVDDMALNKSSLQYLINDTATTCTIVNQTDKLVSCKLTINKSLGDGQYILRVYAEDMTGNTISSTKTSMYKGKYYYQDSYFIDNEAPTCNFYGPFNHLGASVSTVYFGEAYETYYIVRCFDTYSNINLGIPSSKLSGNQVTFTSLNFYEPDEYDNTVVRSIYNTLSITSPKQNEKTLLIGIRGVSTIEETVTTHIEIAASSIRDSAGNDITTVLKSANIKFTPYYSS